MRSIESSTEAFKNELLSVKEAWSQRGIIYIIFRRKKHVGGLLDSLRNRSSLPTTKLVKLLDPCDKALQMFALNYYGLDRLMHTVRECLSGSTKPSWVCYVLREGNEHSLLQKVDSTAQVC